MLLGMGGSKPAAKMSQEEQKKNDRKF